MLHVFGEQGCQRFLGDVRAIEIGGGLGQQAQDVDGHVAVADDGHPPAEARGEALFVGVRVPQAGEAAGAVHAVQFLSGHAQFAVAIEPGGEHHQVEGSAQLVQRQVAADLQVAEEVDLLALEQPLELPADRLGALVVRRHSIAHQAERRG
ncbi:hypothetical protein D3C76_1212780 [compost metagenome]